MTKINIRPSNQTDKAWINDWMNKYWGGLPLVIREKSYYPDLLEGLIAENENGAAEFLFFEIQNNSCEIIVFEVFDKFKGAGTQLLDYLKRLAKDKGCKRVYLMTTNDNLDALRFYQKRGFSICGIHIDSVKLSRKLKPSIGLLGDYDIPVRDEIDLECFI